MQTAINNKLWAIGLGPGEHSLLTPQALHAIMQAKVIVGYPLYLDLIPQEYLENKKIISTGMRHEVKRCQLAIDSALAQNPTAVVCSGDAGIYGMSGLLLELLVKQQLLEKIDFEVIPGIPALCAAAALLGAPLMHDFACISLSDILTPWELILKRIKYALKGDFVIVLYNPRSKSRSWQLAHVIDIVKENKDENCAIGFVKNAFRNNQIIHTSYLKDFDPKLVDMLSIVIIGNNSTQLVNKRLLTPRGYNISHAKTMP